MLEVALVVTVTGLLYFLCGIPLALAARNDNDGWLALLTDALLFGIVAGTLGVTLYTWLGIAGIIVAAVGWLAFVVLALRRFRSGRSGLPARSRLTRTDLPIVVAWIVVAALAIGYRLHTSNFLPWIGDMGAYVNWANQFGLTGQLHAGWPPVFPVFLGITSALFGTANVTAGLPLAGFALILVVTRILRQFSVNRWVVVGIAGAIALNLHAIWFSAFPASEALAAPIFLIWVLLISMLIRADTRDRPTIYALVSLLILELSLLRGSGTFLLIPVLVIAVLAVAIPHWRDLASRLWLLFGFNVAGFAVAYWYGVSKIHHYFVETQVHHILGQTIFNLLVASREVTPSAVLVITLVVGTSIPFAIWAIWVRRLRAEDRGFTATWRIGLIAALLLFFGVTGLIILRLNTGAILTRMGLWYVALAVIAIILIARRRIADDLTTVACALVVIMLFLLPFDSPRLGHDRPHAFFLYWDRYLFSETFPALLVLSGIAASMILAAIARRRPTWAPIVQRRGGLVAAGLVALAVAASASYSIPQRTLVTEHTYLEGAYPFVAGLDHALPAGSSKIPMAWGGTDWTVRKLFFYPDQWTFPNTWLAFGVPLERTFGLHFVNISLANDNFGPDEILTAPRLESIAACGPTGEALVFETQVTSAPLNQRITTPGITITPLHTSTSAIEILTQPPTNGTWQTARVRVTLFEVQVAPNLTAGKTCAKSIDRPILTPNKK